MSEREPERSSSPNALLTRLHSCWTFAAADARLRRGGVMNRNPVASALSLVVCFLGLAALFMSLDAFFIGIIQVLVYAGAVMVLFLFIIMLLDLRAEERRKVKLLARSPAALAVALAFFVQICLRHRQLGAAQANLSRRSPRVND